MFAVLYRVSHKRFTIGKIFKVDILKYLTFPIITEWIRNISTFFFRKKGVPTGRVADPV